MRSARALWPLAVSASLLHNWQRQRRINLKIHVMQRLSLKDTLEALRAELSESILSSEGKEVRFEVGQIELEFQITIEQTSEGKAGIKFWVFEIGGGASAKDATVHKVKIPLKPVWKNGSPVLTGSTDRVD